MPPPPLEEEELEEELEEVVDEVEVEVDVVVLDVELEEVVDEVVEVVDVEEELEDDVDELVAVLVVVVVIVEFAQLKLVRANTTVPKAPQVAFTVYFPFTHADEPPATKEKEYNPVVSFTPVSPALAKTLLGLRTLMNTLVSGPGAGETWPEIITGTDLTYEDESVLTVIEYETAEAAPERPTSNASMAERTTRFFIVSVQLQAWHSLFELGLTLTSLA